MLQRFDAGTTGEHRPQAESGRVRDMVGSGAAAKVAARKRLLVIDDEQSICEFIRRVAEPQGFEVVTAITHDQFRTAYDAFKPSAILLDLMMPNVDGVALLEKLAKQGCAAKLLIMSGYHPELLNNSRKLGAGYDLDVRGTLNKPFGVAELQSALRSVE
jgi:DNA-binding response OmpR family regulator